MGQDQAHGAFLDAGGVFDYLDRFRLTYPDIGNWASKVVRQASSGRRSIISIIDQGCVLGCEP
jgi:hypothetical protein